MAACISASLRPRISLRPLTPKGLPPGLAANAVQLRPGDRRHHIDGHAGQPCLRAQTLRADRGFLRPARHRHIDGERRAFSEHHRRVAVARQQPCGGDDHRRGRAAGWRRIPRQRSECRVRCTGDTRIAGAIVQLFSGARLIATATTDASGFYLFAGQPAGTYTVSVAPLPGNVNDTPSPVKVTLVSVTDPTVNFGQVPLGALGSLVLTKSTPLVNISAGQSVPPTPSTATDSQNARRSSTAR